MASLSTLQDLFNQNTLDTGLWSQYTAGSATMSYSSAGAVVQYPASTTSSTDGDLSSNASYNMTGSYASMQVLSVPGNGGASTTDAYLQIRRNANNKLTMLWEGGSLYAQKVVAGSNTNITSVAYNATTHKYWRIREASGTTYWETSTDGVTYSTLTSQANPITITAVTVIIAGIAYASASSPGTFSWNNFNVLPSTTPTNLFFF